MPNVITKEAIDRRMYWIEKIRKFSGDFSEDAWQVEKELAAEIEQQGNDCLLHHLRLCGDIPESFLRDSSEEKLYSKYTDALLSECFRSMGFKSIVLKERSDAADVEVFTKNYSFVADAKAFRLSRTAKNQKDFKIQAMDVWKRGKPYAMVVCPIYQLPARTSQIYQQASARNVCILTYSHLAVLSAYVKNADINQSEKILLAIFEVVKHLNPTKDANQYWSAINRTILNFDKYITELWLREKIASIEAIATAKDIALAFLATEREKIMRMSHQQAINELLQANKIDVRIQTVQSVSDTRLLSVV
jgi:type II restriction enzyme